MSTSKGSAPGRKSAIKLPLKRGEIAAAIILAVLIGIVPVVSGSVLGGQVVTLADLERRKAELSRWKEAQKIDRDIKQAKLLRRVNASWTKTLEAAEKYFPAKESGALSYISVLSALSRAPDTQLLSGQENGTYDLEFPAKVSEDSAVQAGEPAEEEVDVGDLFSDSGGGGEDSEIEPIGVPTESDLPADLNVKYRERNFSLRAMTSWNGWMKFLENLEEQGAFYRLKKVVMLESNRCLSDDDASGMNLMLEKFGIPRPVGVKPGDGGNTMLVQVNLASYHVLEFTGPEATVATEPGD